MHRCPHSHPALGHFVIAASLSLIHVQQVTAIIMNTPTIVTLSQVAGSQTQPLKSGNRRCEGVFHGGWQDTQLAQSGAWHCPRSLPGKHLPAWLVVMFTEAN